MPITPDDPRFGKEPLQIRRGSLEKVSNYIPAQGELVFATDSLQVFIGDGSTIGGILINGGGGGEAFTGDWGTIDSPSTANYDYGTI
jgi:hypothetical protein